MIETLINPADSAERRAEKLLTIAEALMRDGIAVPSSGMATQMS